MFLRFIPASSFFDKLRSLLLQWASIWSVLWSTLYWLQIPMWQFKWKRFLVGLGVLLLFNALLWMPHSLVSVRQLATHICHWRQENERLARIVPLNINDQDESGALDSRIRGSMTIKGIPPWTLTYSTTNYHTGLETNTTIQVHYEDNDPDVFSSPSSDVATAKHQWYSLPVTEPGDYRLVRLEDVKGPGSVVQRDPVLRVGVCPEAFWQRLDHAAIFDSDAMLLDANIFEQKHSVCQLENVSLQAVAFGVAPLEITYFRSVGKERLTNITLTQNDEWKLDPSVRALGDARAYHVPLPDEDASTVATHDFFITKVRDANGMVTEYTQMVDSDHLSLTIMDRPRAALTCSSDKPMEEIADDETPYKLASPTAISISLSGNNPPFRVQYEVMGVNRKMEVRELTINEKQAQLPIDVFGAYRLISVQDSKCQGTAEPSVCKVLARVPPTIDVRSGFVETPCFGQIGFSFDIVMTGTGPWTVKYSIAHDHQAPSFQVVSLRKSSDHVEIKPPNPGMYTIQFHEFRDSSYPRWIKIHNDPIQQSFHAPSSVKIKSVPRRLCLGTNITASLEVSGSGPWHLTYDIVHEAERTEHHLDIPKSNHAEFQFAVPAFESRGAYFLDFKRIRDANGCEALVQEPMAQIDVYDHIPTASFQHEGLAHVHLSPSHVDGERIIDVDVRYGESISVPLHLTGDVAPWNVAMQYSLDGNQWTDDQTMHIVYRGGVGLKMNQPGYYRIVSVSDAVCSGSKGDVGICHVRAIERPTVRVVEQNLGLVCEKRAAMVQLAMTGKAPFTIKYRISRDKQVVGEKEMKIGQNTAVIDMETDLPGTYYYEVIGIADENYGLLAVSTKWTHRVVPRPSAHFETTSLPSMNVCVGQSLNMTQAGTLVMTSGQAPWTVTYDLVQDLGKSLKHHASHTVQVSDTPFRFHPDTRFNQTGVYHYILRSVRDKNGCIRDYDAASETIGGIETRRVWTVTVHQEPGLNVVSDKAHFCLGDTMELSLHGHAPWRIHYDFEQNKGADEPSVKVSRELVIEGEHGKSHGWSWLPGKHKTFFSVGVSPQSTGVSAESHSRSVVLKFTAVGILSLRRVCHAGGRNADPDHGECCRELDQGSSGPAQYWVHDFPAVTVNAGRHGVDVIREGNEASMQLEFSGHPPFSFSYSRISDHTGLELDASTVNNITDSVYELPLHQAGTFKVTSIADRYCRYPPHGIDE